MRPSRRTRPGLLALLALGAAGCAHAPPRLYAPMQLDGWSAQPVAIERRFSPDAALDPVTRTPVGDEGYYLHILTKAGRWDYGDTRSFILSHKRQPWGHSWLILESPGERLECGLNGNFGLVKPKYGDGVDQKLREGDPDPVSYLWETMPDGKLEIGNGGRTPTFVWRMPITKRQHGLIHDHVRQWKYGQVGVRANNCVDLVAEAAEAAGIHLIHRVRLNIPPQVKLLGKTRRVWTDPRYAVLEFSTPDMLEVDLRHLARFGIGQDVTERYLKEMRR